MWDAKAEHTISAATHHMRVDYSMFEGFKVRGNARSVYSRGELVVDGWKFVVRWDPESICAGLRGGAWT